MTIPIFELLLTSSLLILALIALRYALRGRISPRLQYALWALVLVRLLVPVSLSSPMSVMNAAEPAAERVALYLYDATQVIPTPQENPDADSDLTAPVSPSKAITWANDGVAYEYTTAYKSAPAVSIFKALTPLWAAGALFVGAWFLWSNFRFWRMLRRKRNPFDASAYDVSLPVYIVEALPSPCLFGLLHPAIYLTPECLSDAQTLRHVLAHELTHHRQKDTLWSLLRGVCLSLYWFDPLVWAAAVLSRRDCELSCDAGAIRRVGEEERLAYGRTLLGLMAQRTTPERLLCAATTMSGGARSRRERIALIAKGHRMKAATAVLVALLACLCAVCMLTGADKGVKVYTSNGVELALSKEYTNDILVNPPEIALEDGILFQVYEKASFDEDGAGLLFTIGVMDELGLETYFNSIDDMDEPYYYYQFLSNITLLASDDSYNYYYLRYPYYHTDEYAALPADYINLSLNVCGLERTDFIQRNGLHEVNEMRLYVSSPYKGATAQMLYAPNGLDDPARWRIDLVQPCTSGESGIWAVYKWAELDADGIGWTPHLVYPGVMLSRTYYLQQQLAADQGHQPSLLDPAQVALAFIDSLGADAAAANIDEAPEGSTAPGYINVASDVSWSQDVIAEATARAKEILRQRFGLTDAQLAQVEYVRTSKVGADYNGLIDAGIVDGMHQYRTVTASQIWLRLPDGLDVPEGALTVQPLGDGRMAAVGCFLTTASEYGSAMDDVYLGLIDGGAAPQSAPPSYTEVLTLLLSQWDDRLLSGGEPALYTQEGITMAIPAQYADQVVVQPGNAEIPNCLFAVYEKSAYEAGEGDEDSDRGFLFSIWRFEDYQTSLALDRVDAVFAAGSDGACYTVFPGSDANWGENTLLATILRTFVCTDMVQRNGLIAVENGIMPWMSVPAP